MPQLTPTGHALTQEEAWAIALSHEEVVKATVRSFLLTFPYSGLSQEDLVQAGWIAAFQAANITGWRPDGGLAFTSMVARRVWQALVREGKKLQPDATWDRAIPRQFNVSIELLVDDLEDTPANTLEQAYFLASRAPSAETQAMDQMEEQDAWDALWALDQREAECIIRHYLNDQELEDIGRGLTPPISKQRVHQIIQKGLKNLQAALD